MNDQQIDGTNEISLLDIYKILRSHLVIILIFTIAIAGLATFYAYAIAHPQYKSNADVMVQVQVDQTIDSSYDYTTAQKLLTTIAELMRKDIVLEEVISDLSLDMTTDQLRNGLTVTSSTTSYFININYISPDNTISRDVVNSVIDSAINIADNNDSFSSLKDKITRTSNAGLGVYESPNKPLYVIVGFILGGIVGVGFAFLKEVFNNTFKTKDQLEAAFGIQVLGVIPEFVIKEVK